MHEISLAVMLLGAMVVAANSARQTVCVQAQRSGAARKAGE